MAGWENSDGQNAVQSDPLRKDQKTKNPCEGRYCRHIAGVFRSRGSARVNRVLGVTSKGVYRGWSHSRRRWSDAGHIDVNLSVNDDQAVPDRKNNLAKARYRLGS